MLRAVGFRHAVLGAVRSYCSATAPAYQQLLEKDFEFLKVRHEAPTRSLWVTLSRPEVHNAFSDHVISEVTAAFRELGSVLDTGAGAPVGSLPCSVVFTGEGKAFSAGADLKWMGSMAQYTEDENKADAGALFDMFHSIQQCPIPVIARVNGAALGGGTGLVAAADFAFAVSHAKLGFTEVKLGLIPAVISPFLMRKIGVGNCSRFFATGEMFNAKKGKELGLIQEACDTIEEVDALVGSTQLAIANNSPMAVRACKGLIEQVSQFKALGDSKDFVSSAIAGIRVSPEGQQGIQSFLTKKPAPWVMK
mmetsp:Transcript_8988/g.37083  ORF Transcript_8988/g.37083 Transcript_8988/m.37083 type:complete len:307 (-) Transcript_8988:277-1197(-)|eukprot:CAMPEP_0114628572 /NCGR_PEP_ID=MMETSP0168-20121206/12898_1 /TAXON_ID=95228 ORGANISM="Vannella sp., Strain DIVA3 517/6/12" /NCGR_SAMPLE_ID=MMETSP0168 /ASSEMBLY_ACC=CAM_ASM_000044 /LENGTH=306 /DNA_ID=CAMNT_0001839975 /DNA_START=30 /DNA_END=950 /DNA_ORIENTATION=+